MKKALKSSLSILLAICIVFSSAYVGFSELDFSGLDFSKLFAVKVDAASEGDLTFTLNDDGESYSVTDCNESAEGELVIPATYNNLPVTSIGASAFVDCENLTSITIPDGVTSIGEVVFNCCTSLVSINVDENNPNYSSANGVLFNKDRTNLIQYPQGKNITSYTIPDSVTCINKEAFRDCHSLISVVLPDSVTSICEYAFYECTNLGSITIPDSVTSIGSWAFCDCINLSSITISDNIISIDANSFSGTGYYDDSSNWEDNVLYIGDCLISGYDVENSYSIKSGTRIIADKAFNGCENLTSIVIPDSVTSIGVGAFYECTSLTSIIIPDSVIDIGDYAFCACASLTSIIIPEGVTSIGNYTFGACANLTSITIPNSVTSIGDWAFAECESLKSITIPDSIISIGKYAFAYCVSLTSITIPDSITSVEEGTFTECLSLTSIIISDNVISIGDYAFSCTTLTSVIIPEGVTTVGEGVFSDCERLCEATIPNSVRSISCGAFDSCDNLHSVFYNGSEEEWSAVNIGTDNDSLLEATVHYNSTGHTMVDYVCQVCGHSTWSYETYDDYVVITGYNGVGTNVVIPDTIAGLPVTEIWESAFMENSSLESVTIGNNVTKIGHYAFAYCTSLKELIIPESVAEIGFVAFEYCLNLQSFEMDSANPKFTVEDGVLFNKDKTTLICYPAGAIAKTYEIPDTVATICEGAFLCNVFLETITIPGNVENINEGTFSGCINLETVTIESGVKNIGDYAFSECGSLTSITIPDSVKNIGDYVFNWCKNLISINVDDNNTVFSSVNGILFNKDKTNLIRYPEAKDDAEYEIPDSVTSISEGAFSDCKNLTSIIISENVAIIGESAFDACTSLVSIFIPDSVTSIGDNAFCYTDYYSDANNWENNVLYIGNYLIEAEYYFSGDYTIKESTKVIADGAFSGCEFLTSIFIPDSVTSIGDKSFYNCPNLVSIDVDVNNANYSSVAGVLFNKDKTTLIQYPAGKEDTTYAIPDSVINIHNFAFRLCSNLAEITIPNNVTSVGAEAFKYCDGLISISIPDSVMSIGASVLHGCTSLNSVIIGDGVTSISEMAFFNCRNLISITIPDSVTNIGYDAFCNCTSLIEVTIPDKVTSIGVNAFYCCENLTSITIGESVTSVGDAAFIGCMALTDVYYNGSESEWANITVGKYNDPLINATLHHDSNDHTYGDWVVTSEPTCTEEGSRSKTCSDCGDVVTETIDALGHNYSTEWTVDKAATCTQDGNKSHHCSRCDSKVDVTVISAIGHNYVDGYCIYCDSCIAFEYTIENGAVTITGYTGNRADVVIPDEIDGLPVVAIDEYAFSSSGFISSVVIPDSVTNIDKFAFLDCYYLSSFSVNENSLHFSSVDGVLFNKDQTELVLYPLAKTDEKYTIPETVKKIGDCAFVNNIILSEITIPGNVETIGSYAFNCANISVINLKEGLKTIGYGALSSCFNLTSIVIPDSVTSIGEWAFATCHGLSSISIPENITSIPAYAFEGCSELKEVSFTNNLVSIGDYAFDGCDNLHSVFYNGSLSEWYGVETGDFNDGIYNAVIHWDSTGHEMVNDVCQVCGLNIWSYEAYDDHIVITGYNGVKSDVIIPDTINGLPVTEIGVSAFENDDSLKSISFGKNVTKIGDEAFGDCSNLSSVDISEGIIEIGSSAFERCGKLKSVTIPESVSTIGSGAFIWCVGLRSLQVESGNEYFSSENGVLFNKDKTKLICYPSGIYAETYIIPETVTTIVSDAFYYNLYLKTLTIPGTVETVGAGAINTCIHLETIIIENGVKNISNSAFWSCSSLTSIDIPESVELIGISPFAGCINLTSINVDESNSNYTDDAGVLFNKDKTTLIQYPEGKTDIEYEIPDSVTKIGDWAFDYCESLVSIIIPDSVTSIGDYAFDNSLKYIFYTGSESYWANITNDSIDDTNAIIHYNATDHIYETTVITEVTCTEDGLVNRICTVCGLTVENEEIPALGHDYSSEWTIDNEATCTEDGSKSHHCSRCDDMTDVTVIEATGHLYDDWIVTLEPTCTQAGSQSKNCSDCGETVTESIEALGHDYSTEWTIDIVATCTEEGSKSHHCSRCDSKSDVTVITATGHNYSDWLTESEPTCTTAGSKHKTCSVCQDVATESIDALGHNYSTEWTIDKAATCTEVGSKSHHCSRCDSKSDVTVISATGHLYGDWIIDTEATVLSEGAKHRICSACDNEETQVIEKIEIDIETNTDYGLAVFTVVHAQTLEPISNAQIFISTENDGENTFTTDSDGKVSVVLPVGKQVVSAYAEGCLTRNLKVNIKSGVNEIPQIGLSEKSTYDAEITSTEMTIEEIEAAGIDTSDPANQHVYKYELKLEFEPEVDVASIITYFNADGTFLGGHSSDNDNSSAEPEEPGEPTYQLHYHIDDYWHSWCEWEDVEKGQNVSLSYVPWRDSDDWVFDGWYEDKTYTKKIYSVNIEEYTTVVYGRWIYVGEGTEPKTTSGIYIPATEKREPITIYPVSEYFYLIIRGEVTWLKEMFDVEMLVINNSLTDTLEDLTATLELPKGLSLAKMVDEQQDLAQYIDHIAEGESESVHWYVRGDEAGSYDLKARLQGTVMPFEEEIDDLFIADNQLQVLAGNALNLHFEFPDAAYYGEDYPITITLTNVSNKTLYNISHMVQIEQGMEVYYSDGTSKKKVETSDWYNTGVVRAFYPGDKLIIETSVNTFFESEMMEREIEKYIGLVDGVEQLLNGIKAIKTAFDATEMLSSCIEGCSKAMDDFIASAAESSDKMELFEELHDKISSLYTSYSTSGNKTFDAAVDLANSGVNATLNAITSDPETWLANHSAEDIKGLLDDVSALENSIVSSEDTSKKFNIFDSIRTAISAIPIRFALKNVIMTEDENNTTSIPWSYSTSSAGVQYFGVSNVSKYLMSLVQAMGAEAYEETMPGLLQLIPGLDDPFNKDEAIKYIQATENEIAQFKAKDATGAVEFKAWVERNEASTYSLRSSSISDDFTLTCDNETAVYEDGVLTFTGEGMISVTPQSQTGGTLYIEDSEGNLYTYVIEVVEQHTCTSGEREVVISPTAEYDGFAVKTCTVCGDIMEIEILAYSDCCEEHSFADWDEDEKKLCTDSSLRSKCCSVCGFTETEVVLGTTHTFTNGVCSVCGKESSDVIPFTYEVSGEYVTITGYTGTDTEVEIPDTIDGLAVTKIGSSAFEGLNDITSIVIPDSVISIGGSAFRDCTSLTKIDLPDNITSIPGAVCYGCTKLESVIIPGGIMSVGGYAFGGCSALKYVFYEMDEATWNSITIGSSNTPLTNALIHYSSIDHSYEEKIDTEATCIEDGLKHKECSVCGYSLESEVISALCHDYSAEWTVDIKVTCTEDGSKSHHCSRCDDKADVTIIEATGHSYSDEWNIDVEATCTEDGSKSHHCNGCDDKTDITVIEATGHNYVLTNALSTHPHTITHTCSYCKDEICEISVSSGCIECSFTITVIDSTAYKLVSYVGAEKDIVIQTTYKDRSVTTIANSCFKGNETITSVEIEDGVTTIGSLAFMNCASLEKVVIPASVTSIGTNAFYGFTGTIYCKYGSVAHKYAIDNKINCVVNSIDEPEEPIQETVNTQVDYDNFIIRTTVQSCGDINGILGVSETAIAVAEASYIYGNLELYGTGTIITVFDGNDYIGDFTLIVEGDLNGDSVCDVLDVTDVERASNGHAELSGAYAKAADSNSDDAVDITDYQAIVNKAIA